MKKDILIAVVGVIVGGSMAIAYLAVRQTIDIQTAVNNQGAALQQVAQILIQKFPDIAQGVKK